MELNNLPSNQLLMANNGTVFQCGPVVKLIVANLALEEKLRLLQDIEEEDGKRSRASLSPMFGWKEAVEVALITQHVIRNYKVEDSWDFHQFAEFNLNRRGETAESCILPKEWFESREEFERLLVLCPNLTAIHLWSSVGSKLVDNDILDVIWNRSTKLTSLTFDTDIHSSNGESMMQLLRSRRDRMQYIDVDDLNTAYFKECIETMPNLETIRTSWIYMDFVSKYLILRTQVLPHLTANGKIMELCNYFGRFNTNYKKSSSDGVKIKGIDCECRYIYDELVDSCTKLECLSLSVLPEMDIRRLKTMKNLKRLKLEGHCKAIDHVEQFLPNLGKLEELYFESVRNAENALDQIHEHCPHLRTLRVSCTPEFAVETLRNICRLPKLEYFELYKGGTGCHKWPNRNSIQQKRLEFNVQL